MAFRNSVFSPCYRSYLFGMTMQQEIRKSNMEILRILAILWIVGFHYCFKGGYHFTGLSLNHVIVKTFWMFGEWGVNMFMLLTGFFMCEKTFRMKKLMNLLLQVQFYTILTAYLAYRLGFFSIVGKKNWFLFFFPVITNRYWYVTAYVLIYILMPFINLFLQGMDQKTWKRFLVITLGLWCVIPTVFGIFYNGTEGFLYYNRFLWYVEMYCLGAYYKKYGSELFPTKKLCTLGILISFGLLLLSIITIIWKRAFFARIGLLEPAYFWPPNTILILILSITTFLWFEKTDIKNHWLINRLASTTLGIYMLHDGILVSWLWKVVFKNATHQESPFLLAHILFATLSIFIVGVGIDFIRQQLENIFWNTIKCVKRKHI